MSLQGVDYEARCMRLEAEAQVQMDRVRNKEARIEAALDRIREWRVERAEVNNTAPSAYESLLNRVLEDLGAVKALKGGE